METTNDLVEKVLADIETLMGWCDADCDASNESGAKEQGREDFRRGNRLRKAYDLLKDCRK